MRPEGIGECSKCQWWLIVRTVMGECRRNAPLFADNLEDPRVWPYTKRDEWCGEFKPRHDVV